MKTLLVVVCTIALLWLAWAVFGSRGVSRIDKLPLPAPNPTSWTFPQPLDEVRAKALEIFTLDHQYLQPPLAALPGPRLIDFALSIEGINNALFGKDLLTAPDNENDLFLHNHHAPLVISPVYRGSDGGLPFLASFHLHLTRSGPGTTVTITALGCQVQNGTRFGIGSCVIGQLANYDPVAPTTVEEYALLRYLGAHLGTTDMPSLNLPAQ